MIESQAIELSSSSSACFNAEIFENPLQMFFYCTGANGEDYCNVLIGLPRGHPLKDFSLSPCQTMGAWGSGRRTLIQQEPQSFVIFDKAGKKESSSSSANH